MDLTIFIIRLRHQKLPALLTGKEIVKIVKVVFMQTSRRSELHSLVCLPETDYGRFSYLLFGDCFATTHGLYIWILKINSRTNWVASPAIESRRPNRRQNFHRLPVTDKLLLSDSTWTPLRVYQNHVVAVIRLVGGQTHFCWLIQSPRNAEVQNEEQDQHARLS